MSGSSSAERGSRRGQRGSSSAERGSRRGQRGASSADGRPSMRRRLVIRLLGVAWLTVVWVALWGQLTVGNVAAGAIIGATVVVLFPRYGPQEGAHLRPVAALKFAAVFAGMLVLSNIAVARRVLERRVRLAPAVVLVELPPSSEMVVTLVANAVTLTPGTLSLQATVNDDGSAHLVVHALDAPDDATVVTDVHRLHRLATAAFGSRREHHDTASA
jgi:multicomponent Na+:H+ antiporter subunit E